MKQTATALDRKNQIRRLNTEGIWKFKGKLKSEQIYTKNLNMDLGVKTLLRRIVRQTG